jgi:hypothetical protein
MIGKNKIRLFTVCILCVMGIWLVPSLGAQAVRIMPLGDSITGSPGCWRALLYLNLIDNGYTNIDFVGTLPDPGCGVTYDGDNEGHGGYLATGIVENNQLPGWLSATNPDIVMMFLGTNDTWSSKGTSVILSAFTALVGQMIRPFQEPADMSECTEQRVLTRVGAIPCGNSPSMDLPQVKHRHQLQHLLKAEPEGMLITMALSI